MGSDDQTAVNTPNMSGAPGIPKGTTGRVEGLPRVASEFRGLTLMQERHGGAHRSLKGSSTNGSVDDCRSDTGSLEGLDPYDPLVIAARPQLPVAIHSPANRELPVRVACHRGDWRNYVENTIEAVESCIGMGADIVEVDVWRTKDGVLILNHDPTLDRTTDLKGKVSDYTYDEIKDLTLKDGLSNMTEFKLATVEQLLCHTKDRVFVNLDKADLYLRDVADILDRTGLVEQVILKSETSYQEMCKLWGVELMNQVIFMPVFNVTSETTLADIEEIFRGKHQVYEVNFQTESGNEEKLQLIKQLAERDGSILWINTIWWSTCGGHSDDRAILKDKDANWGYVIEHIGAGILQTDRPAILLKYLEEKGLR